jgi:hypothetical protein
MQGKRVGGNAEKTQLIVAARTCYVMLRSLKTFVTKAGVRKQWPQNTVNW